MRVTDRLGALTPEASALMQAMDCAMENAPDAGLEDTRLREMMARVGADLLAEVAPDVGDWKPTNVTLKGE